MKRLVTDFLFSPDRTRVTLPREPLVWKGIPVHLVRRPRARRYLLRLQPDGSGRLVIPRGGSSFEALRFLEQSGTWLLDRHVRWQARESRPWTEGTQFLFRGENVSLHLDGEGTGARLLFAGESISARGPDHRRTVANHLRRLAARELPARTRELAQAHSIAIGRVSVRAQRTRWGSCSAHGTISLNWRLIQVPPAVRDYLILHELMHRREMNHSARFWEHVAAACPGYREAERWLKSVRLDDGFAAQN